MFFKKKNPSGLDYDVTSLEKRCKSLINGFGNQLKWKWDDRFETVLAEFDADQTPKIQAFIQSQMDIVWNPDNADQAPDLIHIIIDYFGGLNHGQQLFTSDPDIDGILLCAWWPWGNGKTISIRLAVFADSLSDEENDALTLIFRGWFGV